ncbi:MAG: nucleotide pyrophosphohydrolase [Candidatus Shapirobacteria bacterium]|jgi:NTP pyrophosphatase (non-canonical NTP hydrolase)
MDFQKMVDRANQILNYYAESDKKRLGHEWPRGEYMKALFGDMGALAKLTMAKDGLRDIEDVDIKLSREFADVLCGLIFLAGKYEVDLEKAFYEGMDELERRATTSAGVTGLTKTDAKYGKFDR